jgi:hypothetical protein
MGLADALLVSIALIPQITVISYMYLNYDKHKQYDELVEKEEDNLSRYINRINELEDELADLRVYKRLWISKFGDTYKQ